MSSPKQTSAGRKNFWTPARIVFTCAIFCLIAAFGLSSCNSTNDVSNSKAPAPQKANTTTGQPAPAAMVAPIQVPDSTLNAQLTDINGASLKLSDFKGKVVVINMWATWCGPCRIETPELVAMNKEFKTRGVELIGLTTQGNDPNIEAVKDFVRAQKVDYTTVYDDGSFAGSLAKLTNARSVIPQSFVLRDGYILKHFEGFDPRSTPAKLREAVEQAITNKS